MGQQGAAERQGDVEAGDRGAEEDPARGMVQLEPSMDDETIRKCVQERLADGRLPRHIPIIAKPLQLGQRPGTAIVTGSALRDPCAVCDAARTQLRYNASTGSIAFHKRCHRIWTEEVGRLIR